MHSSSYPNYEELVEEVRRLGDREQSRLLKELTEMVHGSGTADNEHSILELQGLGKGLWYGIDAQEYVNRERASWSG